MPLQAIISNKSTRKHVSVEASIVVRFSACLMSSSDEYSTPKVLPCPVILCSCCLCESAALMFLASVFLPLPAGL